MTAGDAFQIPTTVLRFWKFKSRCLDLLCASVRGHWQEQGRNGTQAVSTPARASKAMSRVSQKHVTVTVAFTRYAATTLPVPCHGHRAITTQNPR
jgi:hypothetical protein